MTVTALATVNAALIALTVRHLLAVSRQQRSPALPHWPESLELPIPGVSRSPQGSMRRLERR